MARIRTIKPSFFVNEQLAGLKTLARLLFIGLWTIADKRGRIENRPKRIKMELLPYDNAKIETLLNDLTDAGFIAQYEAKGRKVIQIINFHKHQRPHPKEPDSELPGMDDNLDTAEPCKSSAEPCKSSAEPGKKTAGCALREGVSSKEGKEFQDTPPVAENGKPKNVTWPSFLSTEWIFYFAGTARAERDPERLGKFFTSLIARPIPPPDILARIREPSRPKTEPTWEFEKHWSAKHADKHRAATPIDRHTFVPRPVSAESG